MSFFTAVNIRDALISLYSKDSEFTQYISENIQTQDPGSVSSTENINCALIVVNETTNDATLGGTAQGTVTSTVTFAFIIYIYDSKRDASKLDTIITATKAAQRAVFRYRQDPTPNLRPGYNQWWYEVKFRKPCSTYHSTSAFRHSVTYFEVYTRTRIS